MMRGHATIKNGVLRVEGEGEEDALEIPLPPDLQDISVADLSHPYYWSAFTVIGSPW
ncbi:MAG: hypothetical protein ACFCBU_11725 [Cyanophyceae cyanobacterium]